jgi:hypothetical protein
MKNDTTNKLTFDCELKVKTNKQTNDQTYIIIIGAIRCKRGLGSQIDEGSFQIEKSQTNKQTNKITRTHEMGGHPQRRKHAHTC